MHATRDQLDLSAAPERNLRGRLQTGSAAASTRPGVFGLLAAVISAASFGMSGSFAHSLLATGWTPAAIVTARLAVAGVALLPFALLSVRGQWGALRKHLPIIVAYGLIAVAGCQLFFYSAVERLSIGVAMMLEYTSPLLLVTGAWVITRVAPRRLTLVGCVVSMAGLALVLNVFSGLRVDGLGVLFGLLAAAGNAGYFVISARAHDDLPPMVLATGGLLVGAVVLALAGGTGLLPMHASTLPVQLMGTDIPWWLPILGVALVSAALSYVAGIVATRRLGPTVAAFIGLSEVLFAVLWGWLFVGEAPAPVQLLGGLVVLAGVVTIKVDDARRSARNTDQDRTEQDRADLDRTDQEAFVPSVTSAVAAEPSR